jgi:hypothetical protein
MYNSKFVKMGKAYKSQNANVSILVGFKVDIEVFKNISGNDG